jgi:hypothetical protein
MSGQTEATRQADFIYPPLAGYCYAVVTSSTAASVDLATIGPQVATNPSPIGGVTQQPGGLVGHYAHFFVDGSASVYAVFGSTSASVTGANVPVTSSTGTNLAGVCFPIPAGVIAPFKITPATRYMGFISTSAAPTLRICLGSD